jgi:hypothetical protein
VTFFAPQIKPLQDAAHGWAADPELAFARNGLAQFIKGGIWLLLDEAAH